MSVFGSIMSKIFGTSAQAAPAAGGAAAAGTAPMGGTAAATPAAGAASVDVAAVLTAMAGKQSQTLDWRHSIVDLMKLLGLDSSITNRKALAQELHFTGDMGDSAAMNVWLHKQVMTKLAANGGVVPADLKD